MTPDEKDFLAAQFKSMHEKMDLMIHPIKAEVTDLKTITSIHSDKISILELFKEGHQIHHMENKEFASEKKADRRFNWEIIVGSGVFALIMGWVMYYLTGAPKT